MFKFFILYVKHTVYYEQQASRNNITMKLKLKLQPPLTMYYYDILSVDLLQGTK